jgi:hypothetical protein
MLTITKDGIGIRQFSWKTLHEKGYHVRRTMAFRGNDVPNDLWHHIVCRNEAIFGTCVGPGKGSKDPGPDFQSDPRVKVFSFSGFRNRFFVKPTWGAFKVWVKAPRSDRRPPTLYLSHVHRFAFWKCMRLSVVPRRICWKLTGFELGVNF